MLFFRDYNIKVGHRGLITVLFLRDCNIEKVGHRGLTAVLFLRREAK